MRKVLATILALVFMLSIVAACANDDPVSVDTPAGQETPDAPPPVDVPEGHDPRAFQPVPDGPWYTPFPYPVTMTAVADHGTNWYFLDGDDVNYNPWTRLYAEKLNVHVSFDWTSVDEYITRLNLAIAAGELPDVFHIPTAMDFRVFRELVENGMIQDLTDVFNNYASDRLRGFAEMDPDTMDVFTVDGRLFGIPRFYYGQIDQPWHLWVRKDWYEAAGSPEIRTVADLEELGRTFMRDQGAAYGIGVDSDLQWLFRTGAMFGAYMGNIHDNQYFWRADETGRIRPCIAFPEFLDALEAWQRWFEEGLISPDFMTMEPWGRAQEEIINGRVGMHAWWQWWGWFSGPQTVAMHGDDAYFIPLNLPTVDGSRPARGQIFFPNLGVTVVNSNFQNPAALMKVMSLVDYMVASPYANLSTEDLWYFMEEGREHSVTPTFHVIGPDTDMVQYQYVLDALQRNDPSDLFTTGMIFKYNDSVAWRDNREPHGLGAFLQMGFEGSAYARSQHLFDNGWVIQNELWGAFPPEFDQVGTIGDIIMEEVMLIIMGVNPVSHFESVLEQWYAQGGQIMEDAVNLHFG